MQLSADELARLEIMFHSCQVRSDPAMLSDTDRMMDAMRRSAGARENDARRAGGSAPADNRPNWTTGRTLDELIHVRQALMGDEEQRF